MQEVLWQLSAYAFLSAGMFVLGRVSGLRDGARRRCGLVDGTAQRRKLRSR